MDVRWCRQCGSVFTPNREDHFFCSPKCVAAWYRANSNPEYIHAEKEHVNEHQCEQCGKWYAVNDYAQRGGKRVPKYCSPKCKQAAYRARGAATKQQADRRYAPGQDNTVGGKAAGGKRTSRNPGGRPNASPPPPPPSGTGAKKAKRNPDFWDGYGSRYTAACAWLNLDGDKSYAQATITAAWKRAMKKEHPDVSTHPDSTWRAQAVNWAYEYLKKA